MFSVDQYQENISLLALALNLWKGRTIISPGWSLTALHTKFVFMLRKFLVSSKYIPVSFHILSCIPSLISCT